jgi:nucleoside-diphosphate-sugar epimerase
VLRKLEVLTGCKAQVQPAPPRPGDQRSTSADTTKLTRHLGWKPRIGVDEGLSRQVAWQRGGAPAARPAKVAAAV